MSPALQVESKGQGGSYWADENVLEIDPWQVHDSMHIVKVTENTVKI